VFKDNKLREVKPRPVNWKTSHRNRRDEETTLARLRIGHTKATHEHLLKGKDAPECSGCGETLTVKHILSNCPATEDLRLEHEISPILNESLGDNEDNIKTIFKFLKILKMEII